MKINIIAIACFLLATVNVRGDSESFFDEANAFFIEYVSEGKVMYASLKKDDSQLSALIQQLETIDYTTYSELEQKAYLVNAYNLFVIAGINEYFPIDSPLDVPGFFDTKAFVLNGRNITLNDVENRLLREVYKDARLHFVLVCGAIGCPPIIPFAYVPEQFEEQIETQTKIAINNPDFIRVSDTDGKALISEIFKWYRVDFEEMGVLNFINQYRTIPIPESYKIDFYQYNWKLNIIKANPTTGSAGIHKSNVQTITPSTLLKEGQSEVQLFNNVYTQTSYRDGNREKVETGTRDTYYTGLFYFLYGVSKNSRFNIGLDLNIQSVRIDPDPNSNPLSVFSFEGGEVGRTAVTTLGPKIKWSPLKNYGNFSIQSAFWIPLAKDPESVTVNSIYPWLTYDMYIWWNQFFWDKNLGDRFQLFAEADLLFRFDKQFEMARTHLVTPVSVFVSYFPGSKSTIYVYSQYAPTFMNDNQEEPDIGKYTRASDYFQAGLGVKYQLTKSLNIEVSYSNFLASINGGAGYTFNLGLRYIR